MSNLVAAGRVRSQDCGQAVVSPESPQGPAPGKVARQGFRALAVVTSACGWLRRELRQTFRATYERPVRLVAHLRGRWHRRSLSRAFATAQLALGQRMYAAGIDDGELGALIRALDEKIRRAEEAKVSGGPLKAERVRLILQLAAAALADKGPLPGADTEYARACAAEAALREEEQPRPAAQARSGRSRDQGGWGRAALGYAGISAIVALAWLVLSG